jgi:predicted ATPase/DNA-binding SARP family transcriptional activator
MLNTEAGLQFRLLGGCEISYPNGEVILESQKVRALFVYLAMNPHPQGRDKLMGMFWGDFPKTKAQRNFRHALWNLRRQTNLTGSPSVILADTQTISINDQADVWLDGIVFRDQVNNLINSSKNQGRLDGLGRAISLYRGDFLEGFLVRDAPAFDEWALVERERLRILAINALQQLTEGYASLGEYDTALTYARHWLVMAPWREEAHRQVMRLLESSGQREAALVQYETCQRVLAEELGVEPSPETTNLYQSIKLKKGDKFDEDFISHLPVPSTPFVGRDDELAEIARLIKDPNCRLLTLTGPGGIGKTRLAIQSAVKLNTAFPQGIFFVSLADQQSTQAVISAVISALGFTPAAYPEHKTQLINYLCERQILLVLDNFEHITKETAFITEILQNSTNVKILVTSRERLNLHGEWVFPLEGLTDSHSAELFIQSASRVDLGFNLTRDEESRVARICQLVFGVPLAIELAAAWVRTLSCTEIAQEIETGLDFLAAQLRDIPERHRSLEAVFNHSWELLQEVEKDVLRSLSIFRGGFRRDAAEQVAGASLKTLLALGDKSLVQRRPNGRYELHGLLNEFTEAKLIQQGDLHSITAARHAHYYADFIVAHEIPQRANLVQLQEEINNIRLAWVWALDRREEAVLEKLFRGLYVYYEVRSAYHQGEDLFTDALEVLNWGKENEELTPDSTPLLPWQLTAARAAFICRLGRLDEARSSLERCQAAFRHHADQQDLAFTLFYLGDIARFSGEYPQAREYLEESQDLFHAIGDRGGVGFCLNVLGIVASALQEYERARELLEHSRGIFIELGHQWGQAIVNINCGGLLKTLHEYPQAQQLLEESLSLCQNLNHRWAMATCFAHLGDLARLQKETSQAQEYYLDALRLQREIGDRRGMLNVLLGMAQKLAERGDIERAVEIMIVLQNNAAGAPEMQDPIYASIAEIEAQLSKNEFQTAQERCQHLTLDDLLNQVTGMKCD